MGEYAIRKSDNKSIKIGAATYLYYSATRTETKLRTKKAASATDGASLFHGRTTSSLANTNPYFRGKGHTFLWTGAIRWGQRRRRNHLLQAKALC